jgi:DNA-binding IclR family transcriptional regulator
MSAQTRLLAVVEVLAGHETFGQRLKDIAEAMPEQVVTSTVLRDLEALQAAGWAQKTPDDRWMLAAKPIQILHHFYHGLKAVDSRREEIAANYTRIPV